MRISDWSSDVCSSDLNSCARAAAWRDYPSISGWIKALRIPCCWTAFLSVLFQRLKREPLNIAEDHTYFFRAVADRELRLAHARFLLSNEIAQADIRFARKAAAIAAVALPITIPVVADINRVIARLRHRHAHVHRAIAGDGHLDAFQPFSFFKECAGIIDRKSTRLNSSH